MLLVTLCKISGTTHRDSGSGDRLPPTHQSCMWDELHTLRPSSISNNQQFYKVAVLVEKGIFLLAWK